MPIAASAASPARDRGQAAEVKCEHPVDGRDRRVEVEPGKLLPGDRRNLADREAGDDEHERQHERPAQLARVLDRHRGPGQHDRYEVHEKAVVDVRVHDQIEVRRLYEQLDACHRAHAGERVRGGIPRRPHDVRADPRQRDYERDDPDPERERGEMLDERTRELTVGQVRRVRVDAVDADHR